MSNMVRFDYDTRLMMQVGSLLVSFPHEGRRGIQDIGFFAVLCESNYDVVPGLLVALRVDDVFWSDDSSTV